MLKGDEGAIEDKFWVHFDIVSEQLQSSITATNGINVIYVDEHSESQDGALGYLTIYRLSDRWIKNDLSQDKASYPIKQLSTDQWYRSVQILFVT